MFKKALILLIMSAVLLSSAGSHPGGLDSSGGHWDRKSGTYHYHRAPPVTATTLAQAGTDAALVVYITNTGTKYHADGCQHLRQSKIKIAKADAISRGYTACSVCSP